MESFSLAPIGGWDGGDYGWVASGGHNS